MRFSVMDGSFIHPSLRAHGHRRCHPIHLLTAFSASALLRFWQQLLIMSTIYKEHSFPGIIASEFV